MCTVRLWLVACVSVAAFAQADLHYQTDFPAEEFRARWERVFAKIGERAFAIVQGFPKVNGFLYPRQTNEFYYLCGVETPQSYLVLDGKTRRATLFLPPLLQVLELRVNHQLGFVDHLAGKKHDSCGGLIPRTIHERHVVGVLLAHGPFPFLAELKGAVEE